MTRIFCDAATPEDPLLGPLFAEMSPDHPERVAAWLSGSVRRTALLHRALWRLPADGSRSTSASEIRPEQRALWATRRCASADDAGPPSDPEFRAAFVAYIEWGLADRGREFGARREAAAEHACAALVVVLQRDARRAAVRDRGRRRRPRTKPAPRCPAPTKSCGLSDTIRPLFRPMDRNSMLFASDLWNEADVTRYAQRIPARLEAGTMPCDGACAGRARGACSHAGPKRLRRGDLRCIQAISVSRAANCTVAADALAG